MIKTGISLEKGFHLKVDQGMFKTQLRTKVYASFQMFKTRKQVQTTAVQYFKVDFLSGGIRLPLDNHYSIADFPPVCAKIRPINVSFLYFEHC